MPIYKTRHLVALNQIPFGGDVHEKGARFTATDVDADYLLRRKLVREVDADSVTPASTPAAAPAAATKPVPLKPVSAKPTPPPSRQATAKPATATPSTPAEQPAGVSAATKPAVDMAMTAADVGIVKPAGDDKPAGDAS